MDSFTEPDSLPSLSAVLVRVQIQDVLGSQLGQELKPQTESQTYQAAEASRKGRTNETARNGVSQRTRNEDMCIYHDVHKRTGCYITLHFVARLNASQKPPTFSTHTHTREIQSKSSKVLTNSTSSKVLRLSRNPSLTRLRYASKTSRE